MAQANAYYWSARNAIGRAWRRDVEHYVAAIPGIALEITDGEDARIVLSDAIHDPVEFIFARQRGGGAVSLASGPRLILASLGIAMRLKLELSDGSGEAFDPREPRSWLARIPFAESAPEIEMLAEEVGLLPKRVRLEELAAVASPRRHGGVFFS
jgi:hypothetical protein